MTLDKKAVTEAVAKALSEKSERKFAQSLDLAINFQELDLKKPENRVNVDVILPHPPKAKKVAIFADGEIAYKAKEIADQVFSAADIEAMSKEKKKKKQLLGFKILAQPNMMASIGKSLGQFLSPRGLLPKPLPPGANMKDMVEMTRRSVSLKTKNLPVCQCIVGNEKMPQEEIVENIIAVIEAVEKKVSAHQIKSVILKTTMGKPVKVG
ncbi:50S ribosomal protein L1 [Candidatus Micrarchaeota archaeon]|nr:50S ribosomal protein L1 [Candidatus Micrarchaeota archaeon]